MHICFVLVLKIRIFFMNLGDMLISFFSKIIALLSQLSQGLCRKSTGFFHFSSHMTSRRINLKPCVILIYPKSTCLPPIH